MQQIAVPSSASLQDKFLAILKAKGAEQLADADTISITGTMLGEMIEREEQECQNNVVFYFGAGFSGILINELRRLIPGEHSGNATDFFYKTLQTIDDKAHADRDPKISGQLQSVSTSLINMAPKESAMDLFLRAASVNAAPSALKTIIKRVMKGFPENTVLKVEALVDKYQGQISRAMIQLFVRKEALDELVYVSAPFGIPVRGLNQLEVFEALSGGPVSFYAKINVKTPNWEKNRRMLAGLYARWDAKIDSPKFFDYIQARVFVGSKSFQDPLKVKEHFNYLPSQRTAAKSLRRDLELIFQR